MMGGAIDVPERLAAEFRRRFNGGNGAGALPAVPYSDFVSVLCRYAIAKAEREPSGATIRDELEAIAARAWEFASFVRQVGFDAGDQIAAQSAMRGYGGRDLARELEGLAEGFGGCAEMARRAVESGVADGRPLAPETRLVLGLARMIRRHGGEANAKPTGSLCIAFDLAAEAAVAAGLMPHKPKDIRGTVANALKGLEKE